jgi:serine/threonine protein kinase
MALTFKTKIPNRTVYEVYDDSNKKYAVKLVDFSNTLIFNSLEIILYFTQCPYLMNGISYELNSNSYMILMPMANFELSKINTRKFKYDAKELMTQICLGLKYLHDRKIVHGDIKPSNILIFKSSKHKLSAKLTDFGLSSFCFDERIQISGFKAYTNGYKAPEIFETEGYNFKSDIWALGQTFKIFRDFAFDDYDKIIEGMTKKSESERWNIDDVLYFLTNSKIPCENLKLSYENLLKNLNCETDSQENAQILNKMCRKLQLQDLYTINYEIKNFDFIFNFFQNLIFKKL